MKILQVVNRFYPYIGGTENYVYNLSKELVRLGHEVTVVCANEPLLNSKIVEGIRVIRFKYILKVSNTNITLSLPFAISKLDFDIIHNYVPHPWSTDWATFFALTKQKPMVLTYQNDIPERGKYKLLAWIYNRLFLRFSLNIAKVIISTQQNYVNYSRFLGKFQEKIRVIPCGVDCEKFYPLQKMERNSSKIFFLSVLDEYHRYKGLDYLLKSFVSVLKVRPDVKLVIGGDGVLHKEYEEMARELGVVHAVQFVGKIPDDELNKYYNDCDIFVLPSISSEQEGFGIVALEAMACCKPVIVTNIAGVSEDVIKHNTGHVIKPCNIDAIANSITEILNNNDMTFNMGKNGRRLVVKEYSWKRITSEIEKAYKSLI